MEEIGLVTPIPELPAKWNPSRYFNQPPCDKTVIPEHIGRDK